MIMLSRSGGALFQKSAKIELHDDFVPVSKWMKLSMKHDWIPPQKKIKYMQIMYNKSSDRNVRRLNQTVAKTLNQAKFSQKFNLLRVERNGSIFWVLLYHRSAICFLRTYWSLAETPASSIECLNLFFCRAFSVAFFFNRSIEVVQCLPLKESKIPSFASGMFFLTKDHFRPESNCLEKPIQSRKRKRRST